MINGDKIRAGRTAQHMTQQQLADELHVTVQAVSQWENNKTQPDSDKLLHLARILGITTDDLLDETVEDGQFWELSDRVFSEKNMYSKMRTFAQAEGLKQVFKALPYMREAHFGQTRYPVRGSSVRVPYIIHPLLMACQAHALGIRDDTVLTVILLHDVCEDCGILPEDLPFSEEVRTAVALLTKDKKRFSELGKEKALEEYYEKIRTNKTAMIVKCIDRCNNISDMALCFSPEKMRSYILETEEYIIPILDYIKEHYMEYNSAVYLLKYQMRSMMETQKVMLMKLI